MKDGCTKPFFWFLSTGQLSGTKHVAGYKNKLIQ